ncbi:hypothetical protein IEQ34_016331 [Dendrobium chrysotoxum]|uniref:Pentatricopeptide repeat-containing protein n=1 Tax=Dendrobium chrysotoxum TaxID=161865 RepID=A0AAV7GE11_DENCH|nr:hypothetical protein IEQ34_016331 [Dendrobium chrysotoxum]
MAADKDHSVSCSFGDLSAAALGIGQQCMDWTVDWRVGGVRQIRRVGQWIRAEDLCGRLGEGNETGRSNEPRACGIKAGVFEWSRSVRLGGAVGLSPRTSRKPCPLLHYVPNRDKPWSVDPRVTLRSHHITRSLLNPACDDPDSLLTDLLGIVEALDFHKLSTTALAIFDAARRAHGDALFLSTAIIPVVIGIMGRNGHLSAHATLRDDSCTQHCPIDVYAYTSLITAYAQNECYRDAVLVFQQMVEEGIKPTLVTYNILLNVYGKLFMPWHEIVSLVQFMKRDEIAPDRTPFLESLKMHLRLGLIRMRYGAMVVFKKRTDAEMTFSNTGEDDATPIKDNHQGSLARHCHQNDPWNPKRSAFRLNTIDAVCKERAFVLDLMKNVTGEFSELAQYQVGVAIHNTLVNSGREESSLDVPAQMEIGLVSEQLLFEPLDQEFSYFDLDQAEAGDVSGTEVGVKSPLGRQSFHIWASSSSFKSESSADDSAPIAPLQLELHPDRVGSFICSRRMMWCILGLGWP